MLQELIYKLQNIFLINLALIDGSFLFSAFKRKGYIETRCQDNFGDPGKIFDIPSTQCEGTHFKLIHTASVILIAFFVSIVLKAAPTTMKHKGNCPFARASRQPFIEIHKLEQ